MFRKSSNRLFYLAIPPSLFAAVASNIRTHLFTKEGEGWNRLVVEKPFGKDLETFLDLTNDLSMFQVSLSLLSLLTVLTFFVVRFSLSGIRVVSY